MPHTKKLFPVFESIELNRKALSSGKCMRNSSGKLIQAICKHLKSPCSLEDSLWVTAIVDAVIESSKYKKPHQDTSSQSLSLFLSRTCTIIFALASWVCHWIECFGCVHSFLSLRKAYNSMPAITYSLGGQGSLLWCSMGQLSHCPLLLDVTNCPSITESPGTTVV